MTGQVLSCPPSPSRNIDYVASPLSDSAIDPHVLSISLETFLTCIPDVICNFEAIGGSHEGSVALRECQKCIEEVRTDCGTATVAPDGNALLAKLRKTAQLLDQTKQEIINKLPELQPGRAEKILADCGTLLGLIACIAICLTVPFLAPTAGAIVAAQLSGGAVFFTSVFGQDWALERVTARKNLKKFEPTLEVVRTLVKLAQDEDTPEAVKSSSTDDARTRFETLPAGKRPAAST